jgi:hypothetical protein
MLDFIIQTVRPKSICFDLHILKYANDEMHIELIDNIFGIDVLVYRDNPYLNFSSSSTSRNCPKMYTHHSFSKEDA